MTPERLAASSAHPHNEDPVWSEDGRCLICALSVKQREVDRLTVCVAQLVAVAEAARGAERLIEELWESYVAPADVDWPEAIALRDSLAALDARLEEK